MEISNQKEEPGFLFDMNPSIDGFEEIQSEKADFCDDVADLEPEAPAIRAVAAQDRQAFLQLALWQQDLP